MKRGKFITFEGGEGAGKSTQVKLLIEYFSRVKVLALDTREPGGTPSAEKIRGIILSKENELGPLTEALLYCAARAEHVRKVIRPALENGVCVVCDRFSDSTLAYQSYGRNVPLKDVRRLSNTAAGGLKPDVTFFLDITPEDGFKRKGGADFSDRMENAGLEFHKNVYRGFCELAAAEPARIVRVDANRTPEEIHRDIVAILKKRGYFKQVKGEK